MRFWAPALRSVGMWLGLRLSLAFFLSACGDIDLKKALDAAVRKQDGVNNKVLDLWARSPVIDGNDENLHAGSPLEGVTRTRLTFSMLEDVKGLPETDLVTVAESSYNAGDEARPKFFTWAGTRIPWSNPAFQIFMAFYHGSFAAEYAYDALSGYEPELVQIYAAEAGDAFDTHYSPVDKAITFYKSVEGSAFNPADEADAIYHEYGHAVQNFLAENAIMNPTTINYQFDALQEGLADFMAAAVARDDRTNGYLASNTRQRIEASAIFDPAKYTRAVRNEFAFPTAWVGGLMSCHETDAGCGGNHNIHQDGRVVSGALNDIRRYLAGYDVAERNCSGADCILSIEEALGEYEAWDESFALAHEAFRSMNDSKTLYFYAKQILAVCAAPAFEWCSTTVKEDIERILVGRGLYAKTTGTEEDPYKWGEFTGSAFNVVAAGTGHMLATTGIGWMPLAGDGYANSDDRAGLCETMFIYPNLSNISHALGAGEHVRIAGISVKLTAISGFRNLVLPNTTTPVEQVTSSDGREEKFWGWLDPGESISSLIEESTSRYYQNSGGTSLSAYPSLSSAYSELAWLVRAPSAAGAGAGSATFQVTVRVFNRDNYVPLTFNVTQTLETSSQETFCQ